jgi:hypothetical protein
MSILIGTVQNLFTAAAQHAAPLITIIVVFLMCRAIAKSYDRRSR